MTQTDYENAINKICSDPTFLGKCVLNMEKALKEANLILDDDEREKLRISIVYDLTPEAKQLSDAIREAGSLNIDFKEYMAERREFILDFSNKFSYDLILDAIKQMKAAFNTTLWMHRVTFYTGIVLIFVAVYAAFNNLNIIAGVLGLGGVADITYHFYEKPVQGVHKSIGNLVQLEAAFLGFINECGFWKSVEIKDDDVDNHTKVAEALRKLTEKTMNLIERYVEKLTEKGVTKIQQPKK